MKNIDFKRGDIVRYFNCNYDIKVYGIVSRVTQTRIYIMGNWGREHFFFHSSCFPANIEHIKVSPAIEDAFNEVLSAKEELNRAEEKYEELGKEVDFLANKTANCCERLETLLYPPEEQHTHSLKENEVPF